MNNITLYIENPKGSTGGKKQKQNKTNRTSKLRQQGCRIYHEYTNSNCITIC